jgi:hypothetical protein
MLKVIKIETECKLDCVAIGEIFSFKEFVYIKTGHRRTTEGDTFNCVNLCTGEYTWFAHDTKVVLHENATLTV